MEYIVFYAKGQRVASLDKNEKNIDGMKALFCLSLIQTDTSGTEHYNVIAPWSKRERKPLLRQYAAKYGKDAARQLLKGN